MRLRQLLIVLLLFPSVATTACGCRFANNEVVIQMGRKVETGLPLGSTPAQVTKFLDDMHIKNGRGALQIMDTHRYDGLEQVEGNIYSYLRDTPAGNLLFFFRDGKLVEWWVESDCGGGCYSMRGGKSSYKNTNAGIGDCYQP